MGQFLDYNRPSRNDWKYAYMGETLLPFAQRKLEQLSTELAQAQTLLQAAVAKSKRLHGDAEVIEHEKKVERLGPIVEELEVFVHEFTRRPDREFNLSASDVTFFDLHIK